MAIRPRVKWEGVDLTRDVAELAEELDCTTSAIYRARVRAGIDMPKKAGGKRAGSGARKGEVRKANCPKMPEISISIPEKDLAAIDKKASRYGWSRAEVIRRAVRQYLKLEAAK